MRVVLLTVVPSNRSAYKARCCCQLCHEQSWSQKDAYLGLRFGADVFQNRQGKPQCRPRLRVLRAKGSAGGGLQQQREGREAFQTSSQIEIKLLPSPCIRQCPGS